MGYLRIHGYNNSGFTNVEVPPLSSTEMRAIVAKKSEMGMFSEKSWANVPGGIAAVRQLNPNIRIRPYYTLLTKDRANDNDTYRKFPITHEELVENGWYLLDDNNQDVLETSSRYFINPKKEGIKERYLELLLPRLATLQVDGVVLDQWSPALYNGWMRTFTFGRNFINAGFHDTNHTAEADALWLEAWEAFYTYICDGIRNAGYHIIGNLSNPSPSKATTAGYINQRSAVHGTVYEGWLMTNLHTWRTPAQIATDINDYRTDHLEVWISEAYIDTSSNDVPYDEDDPTYRSEYTFSLGIYLAAAPAELASRRAFGIHANNRVGWLSLYDWAMDLGDPVGDMASSSYVYSREYTNGYVVANADTSAHTHTISGNYKDINGNIVGGTVTLAAKQALILQRAGDGGVVPAGDSAADGVIRSHSGGGGKYRLRRLR